MSKTKKITPKTIQDQVMTKIMTNQIVMKPKWYFLAGSVLSIISLTSLGIIAVFLTSLAMFFLKKHGPNGQWRLQTILSSLPLWIPIVALASTILGVVLLRKYDFSYKKNFKLIVLGIIASLLMAAGIIDYLGVSELWLKTGPMKQYYKNQYIEYPGVRKGRGQQKQRYSPNKVTPSYTTN